MFESLKEYENIDSDSINLSIINFNNSIPQEFYIDFESAAYKSGSKPAIRDFENGVYNRLTKLSKKQLETLKYYFFNLCMERYQAYENLQEEIPTGVEINY